MGAPKRRAARGVIRWELCKPRARATWPGRAGQAAAKNRALSTRGSLNKAR
jgi:hypothetical protein